MNRIVNSTMVFLLARIVSCQGNFHSQKSRETSGCGDVSASFEVVMTPGFISASLPYLGHHDCSDSGVCRKLPFVCRSSSCCLSTPEENISPSSVTSHCGCFDPIQDVCSPVKGIQLEWNHCDQEDGLEIYSELQLIQVGSGSLDCSGNMATMQFIIDESGQISLDITATHCPSKSTQRDNEGILNGNQVYVPVTVPVDVDKVSKLKGMKFHTLYNHILRDMEIHQIQELLDTEQMKKIKSLVHNLQNVTFIKTIAEQEKGTNCSVENSATFSMSPDFIKEAVESINDVGWQTCLATGECSENIPMTADFCPSEKGCCVIVYDRRGNPKPICRCYSGTGSCLEQKYFELNWEACSKDGDTVSSHTTVNVLDDNEKCEEIPFAYDMDVTEIGNIQVELKLQKCIPSAQGMSKFFVERVITAEQVVSKFLPTLKSYMKTVEGPELIEILGKELLEKLAAQ